MKSNMYQQKNKIAVVLATYNPNVDYFIAQIESIQLQTITEWTCYISDDASENNWYEETANRLDSRFKITRWETNLGTYRNFERALTLIEDEEYIFLCDQDDVWEPIKIEKLLKLFEDDVNLVHSNAALIDASGNKIDGNLHKTEKTQIDRYTSFGLVLKNSITGCTSAIRRHVLDFALPFPGVGGIQHDLWLGLAALKNGRIVYCPLELISYRQHSNNAIGVRRSGIWTEFIDPRRAAVAYLIKSQLKIAYELRFKVRTPEEGKRLKKFLELSPREFMYATNYFYGKVIVVVHDLPTYTKIAVSKLYFKIFSQSQHLSLRRKKGINGRLKIKRSLRFFIEILKSPQLRKTIYSSLKVVESNNNLISNQLGEAIEWTLPQVRPLSYQIVDRNHTCVIVFVPSLSRDTIFGGLATAIRLGVEIGSFLNVQICVTDEYEKQLEESTILELISTLNLNSESFRRMLANVQYGNITFSQNDVFITTAWWTTSKARQLLENTQLSNVRIYYVVQDFEPLFYAASDLYAAALETYKQADHLVVNSANLANYISDTLDLDLNQNFVFEPQYIKQNLPIREVRKSRIGPIKILIYGRPSVQRNLFLTLVKGIESALERLPDLSCEILSVGEVHHEITLKTGHVIKSLGKLSLPKYKELLSKADLGISLMLSPHPSYPPLEMASAGMQVITNDFLGYKNSLEKSFANLFVVEPNVKDIANNIVAILSGSKIRFHVAEDEEFSEGVSLEVLTRNLLQSFESRND